LLTHAERRDERALTEASVLASEARSVLAKPLPDPDTIWASEVDGEVALQQGQPARALGILAPLIAFEPADLVDRLVFGAQTRAARRSYAQALRALGRDAEAAAIEEELPPSELEG
jgi:hypothetical protein